MIRCVCVFENIKSATRWRDSDTARQTYSFKN